MRNYLQRLMSILLCLICANATNAQQYQQKHSKLKTRWTASVSPKNNHNLYPRPQLERENWTNLNGLWDYAITSSEVKSFSAAIGKILVPYPIESALSGVKKTLKPNELLWYRKFIQKPDLKAGEKVILHFGAVDWQATVYLNGDEVGKHSGGYTAFSFDITEKLKAGNNELVVRVFDPSDQGVGPHGKQVLNPDNIYYTASSGIWQTVWIEKVPSTYIESLKITPDIDKSVVKIFVQSATSSPVSITADGKTVRGNSNTEILIPIKNPKLWSPENPYLYDLVAALGKDKVRSYFGMRKISIGKDVKGVDRIFLNNRYTYNLGTLDQGFWPDGLYTAPTDDALKFDIQAVKAMGFNTIRKHIKVEPARWYYHADKLGMMVWQDMVNPAQSLPEGSKQQFEKESAEIVNQLHNYPSITTWVLFNERWGRYDQERLTKWLKEVDPSRLINGHSGEFLYVNNQLRDQAENPYVASDMTDVHSYPMPMNSIKLPGKVQVCGEFGGIGVPVLDHQWNDLGGWGYVQVKPAELEARYAAMVDSLKKLEAKGMSASIYTQPFDVEGEENGLMTYDREVIKIPLKNLRKIHSRMIKVQPFTDPKFNIGKEIDQRDPSMVYQQTLQEMDKHSTDSIYIRRLLLMAMRQDDFPSVRKVYQALSIISKDQALTNTVNNYLNNEAGREIEKQILNAPDDSKFDEIEKAVLAKYGEEGEKAFLKLKALRYYFDYGKNKDESVLGKFVETKKIIQNKYPDLTGDMDTNNDAWLIFQVSNSRNFLEEALRWSGKAIRMAPENGNWKDTYANLLHKLGRTKEAIEMQESALKLEPDNEDIKANLQKMKDGKSTWPNIK